MKSLLVSSLRQSAAQSHTNVSPSSLERMDNDFTAEVHMPSAKGVILLFVTKCIILNDILASLP